MKSLFNTKWLTFYGVTIAFVVALFSTVTNYGEANLKAPAKIAGRYKITAKNLPGCLQGKALILAIEQSGVFLNGSLLEADPSNQAVTASRKKPSLTGEFSPPQLELSGTLPQISNCESSTFSMKSTFTENALSGKVSLNHEIANFAAKSEAAQNKRSAAEK